MRMRFKPYAHDELLASEFHAHDPFANRGHWHEAFTDAGKPLHLELGCGKGGFLAKLASRHPEINYAGIDITDKVLILAKRNLDREYAAAGLQPGNVKIMTFDIKRIENVFAPEDTVQRIYINFANPWDQKAGHKKHRLTHPRQLILYRQFLADGGEIWFKTDSDALFNDSVEYFKAAGFTIKAITYDLHRNEPAENIRTEHEAMFTEQGIPIKALIAVKGPLSAEDEAICRRYDKLVEAPARAKAREEAEAKG